MDSTGDIYKETIDYIKQIEKEIVFSLDDSHLELDGCITSRDINSYCDILLDKISKELYITSSLEKDDLNSDFFLNQVVTNNNFLPSDNQHVSSTFVDAHSNNENKLSTLHADKDFPSNIDKITNYRYSFYDNSNKISIYIASSSMIDQILKGNNSKYDFNKKEAFCSNIFGCHPSSIQTNSRGFILPVFIENALVYLSKFGLSSVGIFRKSGVKSRINALKKQIEDDETIDYNSLCVYDVADLVKTWLRDLKPHLINVDLIESFVNSKENFSLWQLSDSHRYLLFVVLKFLSDVSSHAKQNQMTALNIAICFTPSLCECETEHHILNAQKCLEYCIENFESLFYITINPIVSKVPSLLNRHTATAIINAGPQDILHRILYERNVIDPLISEWAIKDQNKNGDVFEANFQFSSFLPNKTLLFKRNWTISNNKSIVLEECADLFNSTWHLKLNGQGQTQVIHELELDLRGFSRKWYETTFAVIHDSQLKQLTSSFEFHHPDPNIKLLISEV